MRVAVRLLVGAAVCFLAPARAAVDSVLCPGQNEGDRCYCGAEASGENDCTANPSLCECAEARACCAGEAWDNVVWSTPAYAPPPLRGGAFTDVDGAVKLVVATVDGALDAWGGADDAAAATLEASTGALEFACSLTVDELKLAATPLKFLVAAAALVAPATPSRLRPASGARLTTALDGAAAGFASASSVSQPEPGFLYAHGVDGGDAAALVDVGGALDGGAAAAFRAVCDPPTFALGGFPRVPGTFGVFNQTDADGAVKRHAIVSLVATTRARRPSRCSPLDGDGCPGTVEAPLVLPFGTLDDGNFDADGPSLDAYGKLPAALGLAVAGAAPAFGLSAEVFALLATCPAGTPFDAQRAVATHPTGNFVYSSPGVRVAGCPYVVHAYDVSGLRSVANDDFPLALDPAVGMVNYAGSFEIPEDHVAVLAGGGAGALFLDFTDDPLAPAIVAHATAGGSAAAASLGDDDAYYVRVATPAGDRFDAVKNMPTTTTTRPPATTTASATTPDAERECSELVKGLEGKAMKQGKA
ncbi:hypothetical protein JL720_15918 [Aureococcus anophagefferens]|nr:hypothetical protein JL720_15918 [Aureococcus anophagefferens]